MTNLKKNGTWLVSLAALMLGGLTTACSSDDDVIDTPSVPVVSHDAITTGNDPAAQAYRFTYFGLTGTRAGEPVPSADFAVLPAQPTLPTNIPTYASKRDASHVFDAGTDEDKTTIKKGYILSGTDTESPDQLRVPNGPVFITGTVLTTNFQFYGDDWTVTPTVYVMPGGKLILRNANMTTKVNIFSYGEIEIQGEGDLTSGSGESVIATNADVKCTGNYAICGKVTCNTLIVEKKLQINYGSRLNAKCIEVHGTGLADGDEAINMGGGSEMIVRSYLCTPKFYNQGGRVFLYPNAMADVSERLKMTSGSALFAAYAPEGGKCPALIRTRKFEVEGSGDDPALINQMFSGELKLKYEELLNMQPAFTDAFLGSADDYYIPADKEGCNPGNGESGTPSVTPDVHIDTPEDPHTHSHLSATCVQDAGGTAYVCYHLNEAYGDVQGYVETSKHQGCVEEIKVNDTQKEITSWMMNDNFDFNHLIVSGNTLYAIGDHAKTADIKAGGAIGSLNLVSGGFGQHEIGDNATMNVTGLKGASGNCIVADGSNFRVASTAGFESFDSALQPTGLIATDGIGKHIAACNGGYITLNLTADKSDATITVWSAWGTKTTSFNTGAITPTNGKNVIASDGSSIYVCCGENGVRKFSMQGVIEGEFNWIAYKQQTKPDYKGKPCANGLAIDGDKLYVAYGEAGLVILGKSDMGYKTRYAHGTYSANYVKLVGDRVYIAYGRNGLDVVRIK